MSRGLPWGHPDADPLADMHDVAREARIPRVWAGPNHEVAQPTLEIKIWDQTLWLCNVLYNQEWMKSVWTTPVSGQATEADS